MSGVWDVDDEIEEEGEGGSMEAIRITWIRYR